MAFFLRLSWHDPRAAGEIARRTNETFAIDNDAGCLRPCGPGEDFCCDSVWLPGLTFMNALSTGGGFDWESINLMRGMTSNVMWFRRVVASFHTTMSFHRFPFDRYESSSWCTCTCLASKFAKYLGRRLASKHAVIHGSIRNLDTCIISMC